MFGHSNSRSMAELDAVSELVSEPFGDLRTQDRIEQVLEGPTGGKFQWTRKAVSVVLEIGAGGADDRKSPVGVAN